MRLFIAIPLPSSARASLAAQARSISHIAPILRWLQPVNWHLTLQFLGNSTSERAQALMGGIQNVNGTHLELQLSNLNCFDRAGALVALVLASAQLKALQERVTTITARHGFAAEPRPFTPHITLARWKGSLPRATSDALNKVQLDAKFVADRFALFQSFTEPSGARYEMLQSYSLG